MAMSIPRSQWTVDMVHELPDDGNRYEVVRGTLLVSPSPTWLHQEAAGRLYMLLVQYAEGFGLHTIIAPAAVKWSFDTEVQPDVFVVPLVGGRRPARFEDVGEVALAIEVLSPSTARADRFIKRREYQARGVPEYWIVDTANRFFERWRPGDEEPEQLSESIEWQPKADAQPMRIDLVSYFARVLGDQEPGADTTPHNDTLPDTQT